MSTALSAQPDFAARVSALIDAQIVVGLNQSFAARGGPPPAGQLTPDEYAARQKSNATPVFASTYPIDYDQGRTLFHAAQRDPKARKEAKRWRQDGVALVARGIETCLAVGMRPARGLVSRLFKRRRLTAAQWYAVTTGGNVKS
jgi:hypothetical protein